MTVKKYNMPDEKYVEDMCCSRTSLDKVYSQGETTFRFMYPEHSENFEW